MDYKELRCGNYVKVDGKIIEVESIDEQGINSSVSGGYYPGETEIEYEAYFRGDLWGSHIYKVPEPIPLDTSILEGVGFEINKYACFKHITPMTYLFFTIQTGSFGICIRNEETDLEQVEELSEYLEIKYVHQLQNIFYSLTGQELNPKL